MIMPHTIHFLAGHYITHQSGGFYAEARCTCGKKIEGVGSTENLAKISLQRQYAEHVDLAPDSFKIGGKSKNKNAQ